MPSLRKRPSKSPRRSSSTPKAPALPINAFVRWRSNEGKKLVRGKGISGK